MSLNDFIAQLLSDDDFLAMGHAQSRRDLNLGLGWIYYGIARLHRPKTVVVIGSWRGFAPLIFGKALADNGDGGRVVFIDPSLVDDFWKTPERVDHHFAGHGITNIEHHCYTTQDFVRTDTFKALDEVGLILVDGLHTAEQASFDFSTFFPLLAPQGVVLLHDANPMSVSHIYGADRPYVRTVGLFIEQLRRDARYQVFHMPFGDGLALVSRMSTV